MLMIDRSKEIARGDLAMIPTPNPTNTWRPVSHAAVADTLIERAQARGLSLQSERWSVMPGALHPAPGVKINLDGARLFGALDFDHIDGINLPDGITPSAGIRNSHDKSFSLSVLFGGRVLICANGILAASDHEFVLSRKHSSGFDLDTVIEAALDGFLSSVRGLADMHEQLSSKKISRARAHHLVVECAKEGAFPSAHILPVVETFENPPHEQFKERNLWSLYNGITEVAKRQSPARQVEAFKAMNRVLLAAA